MKSTKEDCDVIQIHSSFRLPTVSNPPSTQSLGVLLRERTRVGWNSTIEEVSDLVRQEGHHSVSHHRYIGSALLYLLCSRFQVLLDASRQLECSSTACPTYRAWYWKATLYNCMIASLSLSIHYHYPLYYGYYHLLRWILVSLAPLPAHHQSGKRAEWQDLGRQSQISVGLQWPAVWEKDWLATIPYYSIISWHIMIYHNKFRPSNKSWTSRNWTANLHKDICTWCKFLLIIPPNFICTPLPGHWGKPAADGLHHKLLPPQLQHHQRNPGKGIHF